VYFTRESATVVDGAETYTVRQESPHFNALRAALLAEDWGAARESLTASRRVAQWSSGAFSLSPGGEVLHRGKPVDAAFGRRVLDTLREGEPVEPLLRFFERLGKNPSWRSGQMLFGFLQHAGIPIAPDGRFLAYKGVMKDYRDVHSSRCTSETCGHKTYYNRPGAANEMPRNEVSDDPDVPCHAGLHVGSLAYARDLGERVVVCAVDPADVVCVPKDSSQQKVRCCRYEVVGHLGDQLPDTLFEVDADADGSDGAPATIPGNPVRVGPDDPPAPEYTAEGLMALSLADLRELAHSLRIVGARKASSRAELAVKILQVVEKL
jgi:hypothetical protein